MDLPWVEKYLLNRCCKSFHAMGNVKESYHSLAKWSRVCLKCAGLLTGRILYVSIQSLALNKWASGLSPGRPLKIGGDIFTLGGWGAGPPGPGAGNPAAAACIVATSCANTAALAGGGPGGPGDLLVQLVLQVLALVVVVVAGEQLHLRCLQLLLLHLRVVELMQPSQKPNVVIS